MSAETPGTEATPLRRLQGIRSDQGWFVALIYALFGAVFVPMGLYSLSTALAHWQFTFGGLVALAFGLSCVWGACYQIATLLRFGGSDAEIEPDPLAPGDEFRFRFSQRVRLPSRMRVTTAFVLRETRTYEPRDRDSQPEVKHFDSPVAVFDEPARSIAAGEYIRLEHQFTVPPAGTEGFSVLDGELSWQVKVRLQWGKGKEIWYEFDVPAAVRLAPTVPVPSVDHDDESYTVTLVRCRMPRWIRVSTVIQELLPHLDIGQAMEHCHSTPSDVLRNVDRVRAERARERLIGAGAEVAVLRGEDLVPRPATHHLPIPHERPTEPTGPLPVPANDASAERAEFRQEVQ